MIESGTVERIKKEKGNLKYDYFVPLDDSETVLLIDRDRKSVGRERVC